MENSMFSCTLTPALASISLFVLSKTFPPLLLPPQVTKRGCRFPPSSSFMWQPARRAGCGGSSPCHVGQTLRLTPQTTAAFLPSWDVALLSGVSPGVSWFCCLPAWDLLDSLLLPGHFPLNLTGHFCSDEHKKSSFQIKAGCAILTEEKVRKGFCYPYIRT